MITKRNYVPGTSQTITQEPAGTIAYNTNQYFVLDGHFKFSMSDISVYSGDFKTLVSPLNYTLIIDQKYTDLEADYSAKTLYCQIKFTDPGLEAEPFFVSGKNFGTFTDNEAVVSYVSDEIPGQITNWWAIVGSDYYTKNEVDSLLESVGYPYEKVKDPSGFVNKGVLISYDYTNRTVTVSNSGDQTVELLYEGKTVPSMVSGWVSSPHPIPTEETSYFLFYNGTSYVWSAVGFEENQPSIFAVYCNGSIRIPIRETHGVNMAHDTHMELHRTIGTYKKDGTGNFSGFVTGSTVAIDRRPQISETTVYDEDLPTILSALAVNSYGRLSLSGASGSAVFSSGNAEVVSVGVDGRPLVNNFAGGVWTNTQLPNNHYTKLFIIAIPVTSDVVGKSWKYIVKQGQLSSATLSTVQAYSPGNYATSTAGALITESVTIGEIIIQATANSWQITSVAVVSGTKFQQITSPASVPLFAMNFKFTRTGPTGYGGGDVDLPYTSFIEDGTLAVPQELGVNATAPTSTITFVTFQFNLIPFITTVYIKINGVKTVLGQIPANTRYQTFPVNSTVVAGDWIIFGYSGQSGSWTYPTATAYIRTAGA